MFKSIFKLKGGLGAGTQTDALRLNLSEDVERQPESKRGDLTKKNEKKKQKTKENPSSSF